MKKEKLIAIGVLPVMWLAYFLFELVTGRLTDSYSIIMNLLITILFALTGYIIYKIGINHKNGFSAKVLWLVFGIIFLIDQGLKLIIKLYFFHKEFTIIKDFLYFSPIINTEGSWLNARFGAGVSFNLLIALNILALLFFIEIYRYYNFKGNKDFWGDMCFVFLIAGCLCSLIDKVFYGGSLDFIGISNLFIADFKDIYINLSILFLFLGMYINGYLTSEEDSTIKEDIEGVKDFFIFILKDLRLVK